MGLIRYFPSKSEFAPPIISLFFRMITFANGEKILFNKPINRPKKTEENFSVIRAGTEITLRMDETISSDKKGGRKVTTGEVITLTVNQDIRCLAMNKRYNLK